MAYIRKYHGNIFALKMRVPIIYAPYVVGNWKTAKLSCGYVSKIRFSGSKFLFFYLFSYGTKMYARNVFRTGNAHYNRRIVVSTSLIFFNLQGKVRPINHVQISHQKCITNSKNKTKYFLCFGTKPSIQVQSLVLV